MPRKKKEPKPPSFFREKRDFISRMLGIGNSSNYKLDAMIAKEIFDAFGNDVDFLSKVKPPFEFKKGTGLLYFRSPAGKEYLQKKYREFHFKIEEKEKPVDLGIKSGDDVFEHKPRTVREFLHGS